MAWVLAVIFIASLAGLLWRRRKGQGEAMRKAGIMDLDESKEGGSGSDGHGGSSSKAGQVQAQLMLLVHLLCICIL